MNLKVILRTYLYVRVSVSDLVYLFLCVALVMLLLQVLLSVLKVKISPQGLCVHTGILREREKATEGAGRTGDDGKCRGIYKKWSGCD